MHLFSRPIPTLVALSLCVYVIWAWVRWFKLREVVASKLRARIAVAGFCFATLSVVFSVFLYVHTAFTGGYPPYHPLELFCISFGFLTALLGLVASIVGEGNLRPHLAVVSALSLLLWFANGMAL